MKDEILFIATLLSLISCSKKNDRNQMILDTAPDAVFKLYNSKSDWASGVNSIVDRQAGSDGQIILENLIRDKVYYFDVYTPDLSYSNWHNESYSDESKVQLRYIPGAHSTIMHDDYSVREMLLGATEQSKWKLIDVRNVGGTGSIWSTMTDCEKDKELIFQKDFKCILSERSKISGCTNPITNNYDFYVYRDGSQIYLRLTGVGIPDDTFSFLVDVIEETVGTTKIKRLQIYDLFNNSKVGIFTKE